jgi:hypothetical protein
MSVHTGRKSAGGLTALLCAGLFFVSMIVNSCAHQEPPQGPPPPPPNKTFRPVPDDSKLSETQLKEASIRYGGSMNAVVEPPNLDRASMQQPESNDPAMPDQPSLVLGPISSENISGQTGGMDAGQAIRETITGVLTQNGSVIVVDAPEERYKNDSPRPDLAARGIRYVVKGVLSFNQESGQNTVFLRAVHTGTGKIKAVASARHAESDQAALQAATIMLERLEF